jgi:hypothetical protein
MIKSKLKLLFNNIYFLNNNLENNSKVKQIRNDFRKIFLDDKKVSDFIKKFNCKPNPCQLYLGVVIKTIGKTTVKVIRRYLYKVSKINLKIFRYKSFLIDNPLKFDIDFSNNHKLCLFFFTNKKISKTKYGCLYKIIN